MDSKRRTLCGVKSKWVCVKWLRRDEGVKDGEEIRFEIRRRRREWTCGSIWEESRRWRTIETDWWVWWNPLLSVEELKSKRALIGGVFTRFGMRDGDL